MATKLQNLVETKNTLLQIYTLFNIQARHRGSAAARHLVFDFFCTMRHNSLSTLLYIIIYNNYI